jgi:hypothetical protein
MEFTSYSTVLVFENVLDEANNPEALNSAVGIE